MLGMINLCQYPLPMNIRACIANLDAADMTAIATVVLAIVTAWYVKLTHTMSQAARDSAYAAQESARHAERAAYLAERGLLAEMMPLVIVGWLDTTASPATINFRPINIGRATALNVNLQYDHHDENVHALAPSEVEPRVRALSAGQTVTIEYNDAIGNRYRTACLTSATQDAPMYETWLWSDDEWRPLKTIATVASQDT